MNSMNNINPPLSKEPPCHHCEWCRHRMVGSTITDGSLCFHINCYAEYPEKSDNFYLIEIPEVEAGSET